MLPDPVDMHCKDIRQTFKSEMEVVWEQFSIVWLLADLIVMLPIFHLCILLEDLIRNCGISVAWHNQLLLELKKCMFMLSCHLNFRGGINESKKHKYGVKQNGFDR